MLQSIFWWLRNCQVFYLTRDLIHGNNIYFFISLNHLFWFDLSKKGKKREEERKKEWKQALEVRRRFLVLLDDHVRMVGEFLNRHLKFSKVSRMQWYFQEGGRVLIWLCICKSLQIVSFKHKWMSLVFFSMFVMGSWPSTCVLTNALL